MYAFRGLRAAAANDCISDDDNDEPYDETLHIISAVVLLVVSFVGAIFSILTTRVKCLNVNPVIINAGKFFGSGYVSDIRRFSHTVCSLFCIESF